jgi:phosphate starvation-inducible PhoH-like protein
MPRPVPSSPSVAGTVKVTSELEVDDSRVLLSLAGPRNEKLKMLEREANVAVGMRGNKILLEGDAEAVALAERFLAETASLSRQGVEVSAADVGRALRMLRSEPQVQLRDMFDAEVQLGTGRRPVGPRGLAQKRYVEAIRSHDLTFGIGPAGTGKTYLAMACAVAAFLSRQVKRIVLTRPAVEAGERLGFLPGDLAEKVNPYLRPLYDALDDMMDIDKAQGLIARGHIEVAPLAFMRGRAQPYFARVLTPTGFRPIGSIRVGDVVIGSDGRPTRVLGVYPQGAKEVFRVSTQDGASTLCCREHLWAVRTADDVRHDKPARVLETGEMMDNLRAAHRHRYELPVLSRPATFAAADVPMDPYALGLLLGDALEGIELVSKSRADYVLRHAAGGRGGLRVANPVTVTLRDLGLCGTHSTTKFVPTTYLHNAPSARLALLQGLLDTDGGPVVQNGRSCRVQYTTTSPRLRDDVAFLVRSLGGVAYVRTRPAEGRSPGRARGRPVHHRSDAFVMDIRLPAGMAPFRLRRKLELYERRGGGRPMRFVHDITPAGRQDCVCIRVAAQDSLYVTDDFLVTHNTLNDSFVILDEAQNTTSEQMRMFLTRLGYHSKAVVTGDVTQVDLPEGRASGLAEARELLDGVEGIAFCHFTEVDVVRHPLVQEIIVRYEQRDARPARAEAPPARDGTEKKQ